MSYLPIHALNLNKAQIDFAATAEVRLSYIDINLGTLISDTSDVVKASATSLTLKAGKSYFIYYSLSHRKTDPFSYDIYIDGVRLNQCSCVAEVAGVGKSFYPQNGMGLVLNTTSDKTLTIRNVTLGDASNYDVIYYDNASTHIPNGAITIFYK
jgi:hypothetical protein